VSTILVVDHAAMCRELLAAVLGSHKYRVRTAANGREALVAVGEQIPDLILLDIDLPELDGLAILRVLRSNPQYKDIPCMVLTSVAERDSVLESRRLGANDYMLKSHFSLDDLLTRIQRVLSGGPAVCAAGAASGE
jgi:CheY-like chemotaxis protein